MFLILTGCGNVFLGQFELIVMLIDFFILFRR